MTGRIVIAGGGGQVGSVLAAEATRRGREVRGGGRRLYTSHPPHVFVFSGDFGDAAPRPYEPGDETRPLSVYGQTKLSGEQAVLAALPQAVVVRTAWVYTGGTDKDFVATMRKLAAGDRVIDVVDDQTGSPTYVADLVGALLEGVDGRGGGPAPERVRPVSSDHNPRPAARPPYSALSARQSQAAGLSPLRPWREALEAALSAPLDA